MSLLRESAKAPLLTWEPPLNPSPAPIEKAQRSSGLEITSALVSLAGSHVSSVNSKGVVGISGKMIDQGDMVRALEAAQAVAIPHNREIIHVLQRGFVVDGNDGIRNPLGMHGYRLEVEAHIITAGGLHRGKFAPVRSIRRGAGIAICVEPPGFR